ncbi:MAG: glycosyltransferase [Verrucomicrobia bacterium]|nr:MAG: glycosyltransferase [Verrucomicrobiota bacterium]
MVNVICMKWGTKYGPEFVNRLRSMVRRHLARAHRFVCFTDDGTGLDADIEVKPLPPMNLPPGKERGWLKLATFNRPLADLSGTTLFFDIDVVIVDSIDCLFEHPGEFCIIHDWNKPWRITGNSSVYRFEAGAHPDILTHFVNNIEQVKREVRNEQEYLTREIHRQNKLTYWPKDWCVSFKYGCMPVFPLNFFKVPTIPPGARVVVFHGLPNPDDAVIGKGKGIRRYVRPTLWISEHWR